MIGATVKVDLATVAVIGFALCVVVFLSSLPWIIGAVMDRRAGKRQGRGGHERARVVRREDFEGRE